ncbi:hypothetical protein CAOG_00506 [Capsaspora owczarzaki ATCC 30864]|uniref:hypothetical protein n=1 Tax=Capsaspora owczarzaki (strain ATCC 30864) TaxID=595528 RepID=UPI0003521260|nr:hypothetical protein CAOG_00506 [Capsaspora owczarzaki ATCC 30864]|eukprot:XP_004365377.2 hypothetical protein CAOG_00506 [Capsaspora owczarzaki ATCC 30864]
MDGEAAAPAMYESQRVNLRTSRTMLAQYALGLQECAEFNVEVGIGRRARPTAIDHFTGIVFVEAQRVARISAALTAVSQHPVATMHGQTSDAYPLYTPEQVKYLPLDSASKQLPRARPAWQSVSVSLPFVSGPPLLPIAVPIPEKDPPAPKRKAEDLPAGIIKKPRRVISGLTCSECGSTNEYTPSGEDDDMVACASCNNGGHVSCFHMTKLMGETVQTYGWECSNCKSCAMCNSTENETEMLLCDVCDRGYHIQCIDLKTMPLGRWVCSLCNACTNCHSKLAGAILPRKEMDRPVDWLTFYATDVQSMKFCSARSSWSQHEYCAICLKVNHPGEKLRLYKCDGCLRQTHPSCDKLYKRPRGRTRYFCPICRGDSQDPILPNFVTTKTIQMESWQQSVTNEQQAGGAAEVPEAAADNDGGFVPTVLEPRTKVLDQRMKEHWHGEALRRRPAEIAYGPPKVVAMEADAVEKDDLQPMSQARQETLRQPSADTSADGASAPPPSSAVKRRGRPPKSSSASRTGSDADSDSEESFRAASPSVLRSRRAAAVAATPRSTPRRGAVVTPSPLAKAPASRRAAAAAAAAIARANSDQESDDDDDDQDDDQEDDDDDEEVRAPVRTTRRSTRRS